MLVVFAVWYVIGIFIVAMVGETKGRAAEGLATSIFGSPFFGVLVIIALPERPKKTK